MPERKSERKMLRKVTNHRICIPQEMLFEKGIFNGDMVQLLSTDNGVLIARYNQTCFICGCKREDYLQDYDGFKICTGCIKKIKELEVE